MGTCVQSNTHQLTLKQYLSDLPHIYNKLEKLNINKLVYFQYINDKDLELLCGKNELDLEFIDAVKFKSMIRKLQATNTNIASLNDTEEIRKNEEVSNTKKISIINENEKEEEIINISVNKDCKDKMKTEFDCLQAWTWDISHQLMLKQIGDSMGIPKPIIGIIESYCFSSAIVFAKTYPNILLDEFKSATKSTQFGRNPRNPLNVLILGAKKTGKTNLVSRYYANAFIKVHGMEGLSTETTRCLIDLDLNDNGSDMTRLYLRLYDTFGFNTITGGYKQGCVRDAHAIMIVFDVSNIKTYQWIAANHIIDQLMSIKFGGDSAVIKEKMKNLPVVMVGSKIDEIDNNIDDSKRKGQHKLVKLSHVVDRVVPVDKIKQNYCIPYNAPYIEVSAKCSVNVVHLFQMVTLEAMTYICNEWKQ